MVNGMKYHNKKTEVDGIRFDSKKEAGRYLVLKMMEETGEIRDLRRQVKYELLPKQRLDGKMHRAVYYIADFVYIKDGKIIVEDVKGFRTAVYKLKRRLMLWKNGIEVKEI